MPDAQCPAIDGFKQFRGDGLVFCGSRCPYLGQQPLGDIGINVDIAVGQGVFYAG